VPMDARPVAVVGRLVRLTGGKVERTGDLLIEQGVQDRLADVGVEAERELADVARSLVRVEDAIQPILRSSRRPNDAPSLEGQADLLERGAQVEGGGVVGDRAFDRFAYRGGVALAVGEVAAALALDRRHVPDAEGEIGPRG